MDNTEPDWNLYRSFLAVLREGSLSAAARTLGLAQPTIGRHIDALEKAVGFSLFVRSQHGFIPTEAAVQLKPYAEALAATARAMLRVASGQGHDARGTVRITASEVVGCEVLPPILAALRDKCPQLVIELVLTNRTEDLLKREADIAVRMVRPDQDMLVARRIGSIELGLHAHRSYLDRHGMPASADELLHHALIGFDQEAAFIRSMKDQLGGMRRDRFALRSDSDLAQLAAIRAGFGIGVCQSAIAARDSALVRVLPGAISLKLETWIAMHQDLRESRRCKLVFAALAEGLARYIETQPRAGADRGKARSTSRT